MKPGIITQARMGSTRLPGKVMKKIKGKTLLEYHIKRASRTGLPVIVATTDLDREASIVALCDEREVPYYRGSESDVLSRYVEAADKYDIDPVIRITSDCPLIDPELILKGLRKFQKNQLDYLSTGADSNFPHGLDFQIISLEALREANKKATSQYEREHAVPYVEKSECFIKGELEASEDNSNIRITVDYPEDFLLIKKIIEEYGADEKSTRELVELFKTNPDLTRINNRVG